MLLKVVTILLVCCSIHTNADSNSRTQRFTDLDFVLSRPTNVPNPFANKGVPADFESIKKLLAEERKKNKVYNYIWQDAEYALKSKKELLPPEYFKPTTPDECYTAVIAYTMEFEVNGTLYQLYRDFNNKFRALTDQSSWDDFPYRSFYYLLTKAIPGIKNRPDPSKTSWRGIRRIHFDPAPVVGDDFYFDYFASTSTERSIAEKFMGPDGTLIQLVNGAPVAMGIDAYSLFSEDEVIVFPRNKFKVKSFQKGGAKDLLVIEKA